MELVTEPLRQHTILDALPKAELHLHLEGSIRPETAVELAGRHGTRLTLDDVTARYSYSNFAGIHRKLQVGHFFFARARGLRAHHAETP